MFHYQYKKKKMKINVNSVSYRLNNSMQILYNALLFILIYYSNLTSTEFQTKKKFYNKISTLIKIKQVSCISEHFFNLIFLFQF